MPSSRKRVKGKLRKAKSVARSACVDESTWLNWLLWGTRMKGIQCSHGAVILSLNKDIKLFMNEFVDSMTKKDFELTNHLRELLVRHPAVFNNNDQLKIVISNVLAMGTNDLLREKNERKTGIDNAVILASTVVILDHYQEKGDINASFYCAFPKTRDIDDGDEREALRFFSKRISCACLDSLYAQAKSKQKVGKCYACKKTFKRSALRVCERCRISQYCSVDCQRSMWPLHKGDCDSWSQCRAWCIDYGFI
jgi:hypothetical protein